MNYFNEKGNALVITLFVLVLVSVLGFSLLTVTANSNKTTVNERYDQSIYYIAEAGLNLEKARLYEEINEAFNYTLNESKNKTSFDFNKVFNDYLCDKYNDACNASVNQYNNFLKQHNKQPIATTKIIKKCEPTTKLDCTFTLQSEGYFEDQPTKTRQLAQELKVTSTGGGVIIEEDIKNVIPFEDLPYKDIAAFVHQLNSANGNAKVCGNFVTNNDSRTNGNGNFQFYNGGQVIPTSSPINLNAYLPPVHTSNPNYSTLPEELYRLQASDLYIPKLSGGVELNVGELNRTIYVDELDISGHIKVKGSGYLNIVVLNKASLNTGSIKREDANPSKLNIYYKGTDTLSIGSKGNNGNNGNNNTDVCNADKIFTTQLLNSLTTIGGSIHIEKSSVDLDSSHIIGNLYIHSNTSLQINSTTKLKVNYIVAPKTSVRENGTAVVNGVLISNQLDIKGNITVIKPTNITVPLPDNPPSEYGNLQIIESDMEEQ